MGSIYEKLINSKSVILIWGLKDGLFARDGILGHPSERKHNYTSKLIGLPSSVLKGISIKYRTKFRKMFV
jgi:hypothetical protein